MRNKTRDSTRDGRTAAVNAPPMPVTTRPRYYDEDLSSSTRPDYRQKPAPMPQVPGDLRYPTATLLPYTGGETSNYTYTPPPHESDSREVMIMWVSCSSAHPTSLASQQTLLATDSIMGATGSGKSTVCLFLATFAAPPRNLTIYFRGFHSSLISSVGPVKASAVDYNPVQTLYKWWSLLISTTAVLS